MHSRLVSHTINISIFIQLTPHSWTITKSQVDSEEFVASAVEEACFMYN
jgi:hypothetical protein